jgi:hypothetical protein
MQVIEVIILKNLVDCLLSIRAFGGIFRQITLST